MKTIFQLIMMHMALLLSAGPALAQGTVFTYQGRLDDGGSSEIGRASCRERV